MKRLVTYFTERSLMVNIISFGLITAGILLLFNTNREAFPKIDYQWVIITTAYPGATPEDIEKHISIPLENQLREIDGIEEIYSTSLESRSVISIKLDPDIKNKYQTINDMKGSLERVTDLPEDSEDPLVLELNSALFPVIEISITKESDIRNDNDERELRGLADILEDRLQELPGVAKIDKKGYRDREYIVEADPSRLERFHIGINEISGSLSRKNLNHPAGFMKQKDREVMIRIIGEVTNSKDIQNVLVRANDMGNWVRIGDLATVRDSFEEESVLNKTSGKKSITLTVIKKEKTDIVTLVDQVTEIVDNFRKSYGEGYAIKSSNDLSFFVRRRLKVLNNNGIVGLLLVVIILFFTLGWRISMVTALGIPLAFSGTIIWMYNYNVSINLMSMFGLIVVLGMLVDDAIIVSENVYRHLEEGHKPREAVIRGTSEVIIPVAGTIMTTIAAFSPLMFMSGIMGKFMWTLPAIVTVALLMSWGESMFILPCHILDMEKGRKVPVYQLKKQKKGTYQKIQEGYTLIISFVLKHKYKFALLITAIFISTLFFARANLKLILFPQGNIERFVIKAEAKKGTSMKMMSGKIAMIEKIVARLPGEELDNFISTTGIMQENPMDPDTKRGSNYGIVIVNLTPENERKRKADEIIESIRKMSSGIKGEFEKLEFAYIRHGPPVGKAVNVTIKGDDFTTLRSAAAEFIKYLKKIEGVKDIKDNYEEGKSEMRISIDEKTASIAGISVFDIASTVRTCFNGDVPTKIKKSDEEIDLRVIFPESLRNRLDTLNRVKIANPQGNLIPLSGVAHFTRTTGLSLINRNSWKRALKVTADIDENAKDVTSVYVNSLLQKKFRNIDRKYPGLIVDYLGEFKDTQESIENLIRSFFIALIIIYIILVGLFRSLAHPLIIMGVIPLTFTGVIWAFYLHGMPLSFLALMGIVGLAGVVVNDSIVLVDFIRKYRVSGHRTYEATIKACANRLRPVYLTTITTFFGLIPTAYGLGGYDPFLKPMAISMSWGLAFGTLITLFATPILYNIFADARRMIFQALSPAGEYTDKSGGEEKNEEREDLKEKLVKIIKSDFRKKIRKEIRENLAGKKR